MNAVALLSDFVFGVSALTKTKRRRISMIVRLYSGPQLVVQKRMKVPVALVGRAKLIVVPSGKSIKISHVSFDGSWDMTRLTLSFDSPVLMDFETAIPEWPNQRCPPIGAKLIVSPQQGCSGLLELSNNGWG